MIPDGMTKWLPGWIAKGWRKGDGKPVLNRELWERIIVAAEGKAITWEWVRAHAGDPMNEERRNDWLVSRWNWRGGELPKSCSRIDGRQGRERGRWSLAGNWRGSLFHLIKLQLSLKIEADPQDGSIEGIQALDKKEVQADCRDEDGGFRHSSGNLRDRAVH